MTEKVRQVSDVALVETNTKLEEIRNELVIIQVQLIVNNGVLDDILAELQDITDELVDINTELNTQTTLMNGVSTIISGVSPQTVTLLKLNHRSKVTVAVAPLGAGITLAIQYSSNAVNWFQASSQLIAVGMTALIYQEYTSQYVRAVITHVGGIVPTVTGFVAAAP